ncbi:MAG: hypothetical protein KA144_02135 [Xanthomonadaceae bacterium]|nr:hypothetical protein [Xanthomonadaceae bacterium]MBP7622404.1 hypothetical protein [Xanthomonadales bacterium]
MSNNDNTDQETEMTHDQARCLYAAMTEGTLAQQLIRFHAGALPTIDGRIPSTLFGAGRLLREMADALESGIAPTNPAS